LAVLLIQDLSTNQNIDELGRCAIEFSHYSANGYSSLSIVFAAISPVQYQKNDAFRRPDGRISTCHHLAEDNVLLLWHWRRSSALPTACSHLTSAAVVAVFIRLLSEAQGANESIRCLPRLRFTAGSAAKLHSCMGGLSENL
jgi:hypothetical protein